MVLVARHGKPVYCRGFGLQNDGTASSLATAQTQLQHDSIFRIYSMTKPITSMALMMLYEEGAFQLSDPAWLYLGEAWKKSNMRVWKAGFPKDGNVETQDCKRNITILQLLTHTSGLSHGLDTSGSVNPVDAIYHQTPGIVNGSGTRAEFVAKLAGMPLLFQPGSHWHYGFNSDVCGHLVEVLSGMTLQEFMQERIFRPLGMVDTDFWVPPEKRHRFCDIYFDMQAIGKQGLWNISKKSSQMGYIRDTGIVSPAGLVSTMHDYWRFCQCILNGGELDGARLVSAKTAEWMAINHLPGNKDMIDLAVPSLRGYSEVSGPGEGFGLGFSVTTNPTASRIIGSEGNLGWGGLANTSFWLDPRERIVCIWMTQTIGVPPRDPAKSRLRHLVYASIVDRKLFDRPARL
eukprot:TRINITY_DN78892_c0_g1_i1.p1 TRINITY_DN78892_c0_g1~~TRINITY_DN78892_c0_g1_i1.p1  ORF type:complete len:468 (-),score=76.63 TRINITY_DN78892_c0_g1_i1:358-1566(-)